MLRVSEHGIALAPLDHLPGKHNHDLFGDMRRRCDIMGDVEHGEIVFPLHSGQQIENVLTDRHVEHRSRLVCHQDARRNGQSAGDIDALALAARQFVRELLARHGRIETDAFEQLRYILVPLDLRLVFAMQLQRPCDVMINRECGIERRERVLEDHLDVLPVHPLVLARPACGKVLSAEEESPRGWLVEPGDDAGTGGLAAAGFTDQCQRLPRK